MKFMQRLSLATTVFWRILTDQTGIYADEDMTVINGTRDLVLKYQKRVTSYWNDTVNSENALTEAKQILKGE